MTKYKNQLLNKVVNDQKNFVCEDIRKSRPTISRKWINKTNLNVQFRHRPYFVEIEKTKELLGINNLELTYLILENILTPELFDLKIYFNQYYISKILKAIEVEKNKVLNSKNKNND